MKKYDVSIESAESGLDGFCLEFAEDRMEEVDIMLKCLESSNYRVIHEYTHKWVGYCGPYGFLWMVDTAQELKENITKDNIEEARNILELIREYLVCKQKYFKNKGN